LIKIIDAVLKDNYTVYVEFNDGKKGVIPFKEILETDHRQVIRVLIQKEIFETLKIKLNTLCWDNGVDFAPDFLYQQVEVITHISDLKIKIRKNTSQPPPDPSNLEGSYTVPKQIWCF